MSVCCLSYKLITVTRRAVSAVLGGLLRGLLGGGQAGRRIVRIGAQRPARAGVLRVQLGLLVPGGNARVQLLLDAVRPRGLLSHGPMTAAGPPGRNRARPCT